MARCRPPRLRARLPNWTSLGRRGKVTSTLKPRISVVIPTLNEGTNLPRTLETVTGYPGIEVIVVDGGSEDSTLEMADRPEICLLHTSAGKARQMNHGGKRAGGRTLLFLHADTCLPAAWPEAVEETLSQPGTVAGAFRLRLDLRGWGPRVIEAVANLRARCLQMPYGDQALFLRAGLFEELGGYLEMPIMEDYELVRRLVKRGRIGIASSQVVCSGRRWEKLGLLRTTLWNWFIVLAYWSGVSPLRIARWYARNDVLGSGARISQSRRDANLD